MIVDKLMQLRCLFVLVLIISCAISSGCAGLKGPAEDAHDPFERYNRAVYEFNRSFDDKIARPIAQSYADYTPAWINKGITNFFSNLGDVVVLSNDLLQFKFKQAAHDSARVFFNSTIGLFGVFDVASYMDLPKHHEDFGQTLAVWGVPAGPYLVLPILGPSSVRDGAGLIVDYALFDPVTTIGDADQVAGLYALNTIDTRADLLQASRVLDIAALDPYIFLREAYLQKRRYLIYDGNPPPDPRLEVE